MPQFTVLIVDDNESFRQFLFRTLLEQTACQVIGQASDGLEAIRKAQELQPDLILLDLGLPKLNGMDVLRRIRKLSLHPRILVVSQDSSIEIVEAALSLGAQGYLLKSDSADLSDAVEAVMKDRQFVRCRR